MQKFLDTIQVSSIMKRKKDRLDSFKNNYQKFFSMIKFLILNMYGLFFVDYASIKLLKVISIKKSSDLSTEKELMVNV